MLCYGMLLRDKIANFFDLVNNNKRDSGNKLTCVYINAPARRAGSAATCHAISTWTFLDSPFFFIFRPSPISITLASFDSSATLQSCINIPSHSH